MVVLTNTDGQTVQPGATISLPMIAMSTGTCTCHRKNSSSVKMTKSCTPYLISFSGDIGATTETTAVSIAIAVGGEILPETVMTSTSEAAGDINNVSKTTAYINCCRDYDRVTVVNNSTVPVNVGPNPSLLVKSL